MHIHTLSNNETYLKRLENDKRQTEYKKQGIVYVDNEGNHYICTEFFDLATKMKGDITCQK